MKRSCRTEQISIEGIFKRFVLSLLFGMAFSIISGCVASPTVPDEVAGESTPTIRVVPAVARPGELISANGSGWDAGETVYLQLRSAMPGIEAEEIVAVVKTGNDGRFSIAFFYPDDSSWRDITSVAVSALADQSDQEASTEMALVTSGIQLDEGKSIKLPIIRSDSEIISDGSVSGDRINLRSGPSLDYPVLDVVEGGATFIVLGQNSDGTWLRIRLSEGVEGWMLRSLTDYVNGAPVVAAPPLPTPTPVEQSLLWYGEYFDNRSLAGAPRLIRGDQSITFDWAYGAPSANLPSDDFSVRWIRTLYFPVGMYRFNLTVDDGARVWIDGELLIDAWVESPLRTHSVDHSFTGTGPHLIQIDYFEGAALESS